MRSIVTVGLMLIVLYPLSPLLLIEEIIKRFSPETCYRHTYNMIHLLMKVIRRVCGTEIELIGFENIPKDRPVLYVSNHRSYFDIFMTYAITETQVGYVAKKEIAKIPLTRPWMENMHCIFLDRDDIRSGMKMIQEGSDTLKNGTSMWIYPEGHATNTDTMLPFKGGSFKLATKARCPILPVTIWGTENIYERHRPWVKKTKITLIYGEPIETAGMSREDERNLPETVQNIIIQNLRDLAIRDGREPADPPIDPDLWEKRNEI